MKPKRPTPQPRDLSYDAWVMRSLNRDKARLEEIERLAREHAEQVRRREAV